MPHITPVLRHDSFEVIMDKFGGGFERFRRTIEIHVSNSFNSRTGEDLEPGVSTKCYDPVLTSSCPVDLMLQVGAWWSPARAPHLLAIEQDIELRLGIGLDGAGSVNVYVNAAGNPSKDPKIMAMSIDQLLGGVASATHMSNRLSHAGYDTIGDLMRSSEVDLRHIPGISDRTAYTIIDRLNRIGVRLPSTNH